MSVKANARCSISLPTAHHILGWKRQICEYSSIVSRAAEHVPEPSSDEVGADVKTSILPRRATRARTTPEWYGDLIVGAVISDDLHEPANYKEAMEGPESEKWLEAMKSEIGSMHDNKLWTLIDIPEGRKTVENKCIFKKKTDANGNVTVYKAWLVAKGFRQILGIDYDETFSPVTMLKSILILVAISAYFDYETWQMDVKTAFLNGNIEEELYMVQPEGFIEQRVLLKYASLIVPFMD